MVTKIEASNITNTGVVSGTYINPTIQVNEQGQVTSAVNNSGSEIFNILTGATGIVEHNYNLSAIWLHNSVAANFTANFTNVPTTNGTAISFALLINQGASAYYPNLVQIGGENQTILWTDNSTPTPLANKTELYSFLLIRNGSTWKVLGSSASFG